MVLLESLANDWIDKLSSWLSANVLQYEEERLQYQWPLSTWMKHGVQILRLSFEPHPLAEITFFKLWLHRLRWYVRLVDIWVGGWDSVRMTAKELTTAQTTNSASSLAGPTLLAVVRVHFIDLALNIILLHLWSIYNVLPHRASHGPKIGFLSENQQHHAFLTLPMGQRSSRYVPLAASAPTQDHWVKDRWASWSTGYSCASVGKLPLWSF